jgi:TolB protein
LAGLRNKIIFLADDPEQPGYWAMDPSGENRQYLGHPDYYAQELNAYREREAFSPDGRYRAVVQQGAQSPQIFILLPQDDYPNVPPQELTRLTHMSYDPVWSPDGGRIAFTSHENGIADIWVINTDGTGGRYLVRNDWDWDKHPSWSPDSRFIAFWSNRNLLKQIYVMDAQTGRLRNISETQWDEYDPVWIK